MWSLKSMYPNTSSSDRSQVRKPLQNCFPSHRFKLEDTFPKHLHGDISPLHSVSDCRPAFLQAPILQPSQERRVKVVERR